MSARPSPISLRLASRLARPVDHQTRERARRHLLDWLACAVGGTREPGTIEPRRLAAKEGPGPCRIVGGACVGPQSAALANGPLGAILEMDDVDKRALLHPGPVVIPAALAIAQATGIGDGNALLDAIVRGYEAMIRVGRAAGPAHYRYFHATGTCGAFGAAAAGASLLKLDDRASAWALGNAGQQAAGLWQVRNEPVFTKALHNGRAAANGVAAALLAADGYAGPLFIFEGPQAFFAALCGNADPEGILPPDDEPWAIHDVSFKPHAACRHAHAAIDAVLELRARARGRTPQRLSIATYRDALLFCDKPDPHTVGEAKFSLQHAAAAAWVHGDADLPRFTRDAIVEPALVDLRGHVIVTEDAEITASYPARFGARAAARFDDGTELLAESPDALGDPEKPIRDDALLAKATGLFAWGGLSTPRARRIIDIALEMGEGADIADLAEALPGDSS